MSGWQLGLALFGLWLCGIGCGMVGVYLYARRVFRQKMGDFLTSTTTTAAGRPGQDEGSFQ